VARLRVWGRLEPEVGRASRGVERLNQLGEEEARAALRRCCGAASWVQAMAARRPFEDAAALLRHAEREYWKLAEEDWLEAFAAHPRIGGRTGGATDRGQDGAPGWSSQEQRGVAEAEAAVLQELADANQAYVDRFDFVFLICATGRSAAEMLAELKRRIARPRDEELRTATEEQLKITRLRLAKLVEELGATGLGSEEAP
jgi:OHCU decarboxylase